MSTRSALALLVLFAVATPLCAQDQEEATEYTYVLPDDGATPAPYVGYTRVAALDVDADRRADLVTLRGGAMSFFRSAVVTRQALGFPSPAAWIAHDFAASALTGDPSAPRVYIVGSDGLRIAAYDQTTGAMTNTLALGGSFVGATRVVCGRMAGARLVVGVAADGRTLVYASDLGGTLTQLATLSLPSAVVDLCLLDWHGDGTLAVAVATSGDGLLVVDGAASAVLVAGSAAGSFIAALRDADAADELCWLHPGSGGNWSLRIFRNGSSTSDVAVTSVTDPNGIACGDLDLDGHVDCAITQRSSFGSVVLLRQVSSGNPPVESFADAPASRKSFTTWDGTHPGTTLDLAPPVFADVDRDGHADLICGLSSVDSVAIKVGIAFDDPNATETGILPPDVDSVFSIDPQFSTTEATLALRVAAGELDADMTDVEVVGWSGDFNATLGDWVMESTPRFDRLHPLHGIPGGGGHHEIPILTGETSEYWAHGHSLFLEVRFLRRDAAGNLLAASRSFVLACSMHSCDGEAAAVYMGAVRDHTEHGAENEGKVKQPDGVEIGGSRPVHRVPRPALATGPVTATTTGPTTRTY